MFVKHLHFSLEKKVIFLFQSQLFLKGQRMKINAKKSWPDMEFMASQTKVSTVISEVLNSLYSLW